MARKGQKGNSKAVARPVQSTPSDHPRQSILESRDLLTAALLVLLAAASSPISLFSLSPVYGGIPSTLFHRHGVVASAILGFTARLRFKDHFSKDISRYLPALAFWNPTIQHILFQQSSILGNPYGPLITEALTCFPLVALTAYSCVVFLEKIDFSGYGEFAAEHGPAVASYALFTSFESLSKKFIAAKIGTNLLLSRIGMQLTLATLYGLVLPSAILWPAIPSLIFTLGFNPHLPLPQTTRVLNDTLSTYNYTLLERKESITGYISVIENTSQHFKVMRCDHSLLGGEWTSMPREPVAEPIYAIFTMLEAVRLVETDDGGPRKPDAESTALTIGLGIGTTPGAFIMHGISTTIVEIDPVVYQFALQHFNLPKNHTAVIDDAISFVQSANEEGKQYDYIVHDVFTGGAEPIPLFTQEFLRGLYTLLRDDGVIAINYAGDLANRSARIIIYTIRTVFPECRMFREHAPPKEEGSGQDFTNMVIFCKKTARKSLTFRKAVRGDFLNGKARQAYLFPKWEIPGEYFAMKGAPPSAIEKLILKKGQTRQLEQLHIESAVGHWKLMRDVIPKEIWQNW